MKNNKISRMSSIAILIGVTVILAFISNNFVIGNVNINLALVPIVIGACLFGPKVGFILGAVDGLIICVSPSTLMFFMPYNPIITILLCVLKTGVGGFLAGIFYNILKNKSQYLGVFVASITLPIINTLIFLIGVFIFFIPVYYAMSGNSENVGLFIIKSTLTINFLIEFIVNIILSSSIYRIIKYKSKY